jgi:hypothetical protein
MPRFSSGRLSVAETLTQNSMTGDWSDEETDEPLLADHHNYCRGKLLTDPRENRKRAP